MITGTRNVLICLIQAGSLRYLNDQSKKYKIKDICLARRNKFLDDVEHYLEKINVKAGEKNNS
jgi:hypothetical protein